MTTALPKQWCRFFMSGDFRGACLVFRMPPKMAARRGLPTTLRRSILGVSLLRAQGQNKISHGRLCSDWITRPADRRGVSDWIAAFRKWRTLTVAVHVSSSQTNMVGAARHIGRSIGLLSAIGLAVANSVGSLSGLGPYRLIRVGVVVFFAGFSSHAI